MDAGLIGCFWEPDVTRLAAMGEAPSRTLLGTRHYQVDSDGGGSTAPASSKLAYMDAFVI